MRVWIMMAFGLLSACCQDPATCKAPEPDTCPDDAIVGDWETVSFVGTPFTDGGSLGGTTETCWSTDYDFALKCGGYYDGGLQGSQLWCEIATTGQAHVKEKHDDPSFYAMQVEDFVSFNTVTGSAQAICDSIGTNAWECDWESDLRTVEHTIALELDSVDPNILWMVVLSPGYSFMGEEASGVYDCTWAESGVTTIKLQRVSAASTANLTVADGHQLYECIDETTSDTGDTGGDSGDTGTPPPMAQPVRTYQGLTPGEWAWLAAYEWTGAALDDRTRGERHAQADVILASLYHEDAMELAPFVHDAVDRSFDDPLFAQLVNGAANQIMAASPEESEMIADHTARIFMDMYNFWVGRQMTQPFNPPPPPPQ